MIILRLLSGGFFALLLKDILIPLVGFNWGLLIGFIIGFTITLWIGPLIQKVTGTFFAKKSENTVKNFRESGFGLTGGVTTGKLLSRGDAVGVNKGQTVSFNLEDSCINFAVFGAPGSGKTTAFVVPMLDQIFAQSKNAGALIYDIKGDFGDTVHKLAARRGKNIEVIGPTARPMNLLKNLEPEVAAGFLKSAFYLQGGVTGDSFWINSATEVCKNALGILSFCPGHYSLIDLYDFVWFPDKKAQFLATAEQNAINDQDRRLLSVYKNYLAIIYAEFDEKTQKSVEATISDVLAAFANPKLTDYFCSDVADAVSIEDVLTGSIILVDLPLALYGPPAKTIYTLIKLRFFNVLQSRQARKDLDQNTPVAFVCDEYQELVSANRNASVSDLSFWSVSRSAKCIGLISSQSVAAWRTAIGDRQTADAVLANFRQKYLFTTTDPDTIDYFNRMTGAGEVIREGTSENISTSWGNRGDSEGKSWNIVDKSIVDAQLIRSMPKNHAVAILTLRGQNIDDVVVLNPMYL